MVEFTLIAPTALLLLMGIIVVGIVVTNYIQLTNVARDGARIAAICGSGLADGQAAQMADGSGSCGTSGAVETYITNHLVTVPSLSVSPVIFVCTPQQAAQGACTNNGLGFTDCQPGRIVEVDMNYAQPLYLPLISNIFETNPNGTMNLKASAQATCEQ